MIETVPGIDVTKQTLSVSLVYEHFKSNSIQWLEDNELVFGDEEAIVQRLVKEITSQVRCVVGRAKEQARDSMRKVLGRNIEFGD